MTSHANVFLKGVVISAVLLAVMLGCDGGAPLFKIRFDDVHGLRKGDTLYLDASAIGSVDKVDYTDTGVFLVSVSIQKEFASAATDTSKFYIDVDPQERQQRVIRVVQLEKGGRPIENGSIVDGDTKFTVLYEQFTRQLGKNIAVLESGINAFLEELQGFPESEQVRELERQLDEIIADLGNMSSEMKATLENEILPLLREKIEALRKSLERAGRGDDLESIDRKMDMIDKELQV
jgi:hypothetical protein